MELKYILIAGAVVSAAAGLWLMRSDSSTPARRSGGLALVCVGFCLALSALSVALSG